MSATKAMACHKLGPHKFWLAHFLKVSGGSGPLFKIPRSSTGHAQVWFFQGVGFFLLGFIGV